MFNGKIISIDGTNFQYKLIKPLNRENLNIKDNLKSDYNKLQDLLIELEKSYSHIKQSLYSERKNHGETIEEILIILKNTKIIKNQDDFAYIIGIKNAATISRVIKGKNPPKLKRKRTIKTAVHKLKKYINENKNAFN